MGRAFPAAITALLALKCPEACAQEAIGQAHRVEDGRRARKEAIDRNLYNLKAGPVLMRFETSMAFEVNDNPHLLDDPGRVDFAFQPQLDIATLWALDPYNALTFNLGLGYRKYVHNTDLDHLIIAPDSELSFDVRTRDVTINFHERVAHVQDPVGDPTVSGTGDFAGIENTVGVRADWDLNQLTLSAGYDHFNFFSTGSPLSDVQERSSEFFYASAELEVQPAITTGLELGGGLTDYCQEIFSDSSQFSIGPFVALQLTRELRVRVSGGYLRYDFDQNGTTLAPGSVSDFYGEIAAEHELSQYMNHRLAVGRGAGAGAASELVTLWYLRYENNWSLSQYATLRSALFYENGEEQGGFVDEKLWRVGASFGISVPLTRKLTGTAGYQVLYKDSDQTARDYLQNMATLEFRYVF